MRHDPMRTPAVARDYQLHGCMPGLPNSPDRQLRSGSESAATKDGMQATGRSGSAELSGCLQLVDGTANVADEHRRASFDSTRGLSSPWQGRNNRPAQLTGPSR
jgi:hypothetical protein